ncbi:hypothetical protein GCM10008090_30810 [Arenicella chitinivorans]|uniref:Uncharacterized protein n=1 Tax=Arenicella chitinivorans TaxID=1329800 RepID=A0A918S1C0_9GAMM|nr:hypothetical protein GCM10008090_30810 [Arenicella chitinivorans]
MSDSSSINSENKSVEEFQNIGTLKSTVIEHENKLSKENLSVSAPKAILFALRTLEETGCAHNDHQQHHDSDNR